MCKQPITIAVNEDNRPVEIEYAVTSVMYRCTECNNLVIPVLNTAKRQKHFRHKIACKMTEWHSSWGSVFNKTEYTYKVGDVITRADALTDDEKTVLEFQHSCIGPRTVF